MGKFCLPAVSLSSAGRLLGCLSLFLCLAGFPVHAASNRASAVSHIQVTVVPTVQVAPTQPTATSTTGSVTYNLQPSSPPHMTSQVTVQQISTGTASAVKRDGQSGKGAVLKTTVIVAE